MHMDFKIWLVWLIIYAVLKSPGIKGSLFPIPQESRLVPKVIGTVLLIKAVGRVRTASSTVLLDAG